MCGIVGSYNGDLSQSKKAEALKKIAIRGKDARGQTSIELNNSEIWFGHTRLSILDLSSASNQPFESQEALMSYNGELYNYVELRNELSSKGVTFRTSGDTEVVFAAISFWGVVEAVKKFNGMFAIAFFDRKLNELSLIRDRAGVKPLYYSVTDSSISFGSTLSAVRVLSDLNDLNLFSINDFVSFGYCKGEQTLIQGVKELPPGSILTYNVDLYSWSIQNYWKLTSSFLSIGNNEIKKTSTDFLSLVEESISRRLRSDVPLGLFLSGGIDSSFLLQTVSSLNLKIPTFTLGFSEKELDESERARSMAYSCGVSNETITYKDSEVSTIFKELPRIWTSPIGDPSCIPTFMLTHEVANKGVKVAFSADGLDEMLGGYKKYRTWHVVYSFRRIPFLSSMLSYFLSYVPMSILLRYRFSGWLKLALAVSKEKYTDSFELLDNHFISQKSLKVIRHLNWIGDRLDKDELLFSLCKHDFYNYQLKNILPKLDASSMYNQLEVREPMLDYHLLEFGYSLPYNSKIVKGKGKFLLRSIIKDLYNIDHPKKKKGFIPPLDNWLNELLQEEKNSLLKQLQSNITPKILKDLVDELDRMDRKSTTARWHILVLINWIVTTNVKY